MTATETAYQTRVLPPAEWSRLVGTETETAWPHLNPDEAQVIVVERDGQIVGTWTVMRVVHVECLWIAPEFRTTGAVARRLLAGMARAARAWGARAVWTAALTDDVRALILRARGTQLPGDHYVFPVPGGK